MRINDLILFVFYLILNPNKNMRKISYIGGRQLLVMSISLFYWPDIFNLTKLKSHNIWTIVLHILCNRKMNFNLVQNFKGHPSLFVFLSKKLSTR